MAFFKKKDTPEVQEPMDLDEVMKKFDRESNVRIWEGVPKIVVTCILAVFSVLCIYVTLWATWLDELRLTTFMAFIVFNGYMIFPAKKGVQKVNYIPWYDIVLMAAGTCSFLYFAINASTIVARFNINTLEVIIGIIGVACLAELCRRSVGFPILIVAGVLLVYAMIWGSTNPSIVARITEMVRVLFYSKEGILSTPVNVCSKYIVMFIIFGAFLERTGIADFFIEIANALVGRFSGGPAKVAVVASALEGMVSGSSVANTVGSGAVTIPLMKRTGYKPEFAAAAEASASTGGQIMPPIMGAAAFLMAETIGMPYSSIVVKAILPAVLYFAGVFITVHLEAKKEGLKGMSKDQLPRLKSLIKQTYLLLPLVLLIYLVGTSTYSIAYAAAIAIVIAIVVSMFKKETRMTPARLLDALAAGARGMISVAVACGIAGIIAGIIGVTGLAYMLFNGIVTLAGNQTIIALFLTMLCCIVLGMGVPTTANYCIMAATCAPILVQMGVPLVAAHFFVFYFGIVADLTPPVALAAYAGAAIAQANPMKTALTSTKLAIGAFIVPYVFALNPVMLLEGDPGFIEVALIIVTSLVGIFGVSAALEGYVFGRMNWMQRILSGAGGLLLIIPGLVTDLAGIALVAVVIVWQIIARKASEGAEAKA
ncbi:MAG: TRAP transporter fused permease subunit [Ruminococcaceae bacterium]|nr:TRAP transporter fused permease subunit [Oscillospiraceae bacterium]